MPSLTEEDPEYPEKVKAYCEKHGLKELPWGFIVAHGHLVAVTSTRQRREHAAEVSAALVGELVVPDADELDQPSLLVEPVTGGQVADGAAAVGVEPANGGGVSPPLVVAT